MNKQEVKDDLEAAFDYFEYICGGVEGADELVQHFEQEWLSGLFFMMTMTSPGEPRKVAITAWSVLMNAALSELAKLTKH